MKSKIKKHIYKRGDKIDNKISIKKIESIIKYIKENDDAKKIMNGQKLAASEKFDVNPDIIHDIIYFHDEKNKTNKEIYKIVNSNEYLFSKGFDEQLMDKDKDMSKGVLKENIRQDYPQDANAKQIWDAMSEHQRGHFLIDHSDMLSDVQPEITKLIKFADNGYTGLPKQIQNEFEKHINMERYERGDKIKSKRKYNVMVDELKKMSAVSEIKIDPEYGIKITPYSIETDSYVQPIIITGTELMALVIKYNEHLGKEETIKRLTQTTEYLYDDK